MPEQSSSRALPVTTAPIESPFQTEIFPYGVDGLNLKDQRDAIPVGQFAVLTNLTHSKDRGLTVRPTLTSLATGGTTHHSARRLHNPLSGSDTIFWGVDTTVTTGLGGPLAVVDTGYSGDPLTLLPHRPTLSGEPWMFVADRARMRKIKADGTTVPIGLPAPTVAATAAPGQLLTTRIAAFDSSDGTQAASWTPQAGFDRSDTPLPSGTPIILDAAGLSGAAVALRAQPGGVQKTYYSWMGRAFSLDLSTLQGGAVAASDQDVIHLWLNMSHPQLTEEVRIYFVVSNNFSVTTLPGATGTTNNTDFYVKGFRQSDFAQAIQGQQALVDAAETARVRAIRDQSLGDRGAGFSNNTTAAAELNTANQNPANAQTVQAGSGAEEWIQYGVVDVPLRRGDFQRVGNTPGADWSTVTGIIIYLSSTATTGPVEIRLDDFFLYGGSGPDDMEPGAQPYDWRYTHYDPRTGAESNPSPIMADTAKIDLIRRDGQVTPQAYGDGNIRQRFYRRGGANINDWFFCGANTADGAIFTDSNTDDTISTAGTVNLDHFQPVPSIDANGNTVLAQAVPILFGPAQGLLFALGDPNRPGHLYWCLPDEPDHWPAENNLEVCSPSEELQAGLMLGAQPYCFSRERLYAIYPNLSNTSSVTVTTTACRRGLVSRWAWAIGLGLIFGVAKDGIFVTGGGVEEIISQPIERLFRGQAWNGYVPIDFTVPTALRLSVFRDELYFVYQGTDAARHILVYSLLYKYWKAYEYLGITVQHLTPDLDTAVARLFVGTAQGKSCTVDPAGTADDGQPVSCLVQTGQWDLGRPREDKLLGDMILDADPAGETLTLVNRLNLDTVVNAANTIAGVGRGRYIIDAFGTDPQRARTISTEVSWTSAVARPTLYYYGIAVIPEPDQTDNRVTQWDDLGHPDESYVTGITFDCDTGGVARTIAIERDFGGSIFVITNLTVQANGRHKLKFSWPAVPCHKVRIQPSDTCAPWILYRADWISVPEPPRIAGWDIHFESDGDQYYTGLDLYCLTEGQEKRIQVQVDGVTLTNPYTSEAFWRINAPTRSWIHLTLPWGRGHVFHFTAIDQNEGLLYKHRWILDPEPGEQANWNQNFTIYGSRADKWLKAIVVECDTFGQTKSIHVEADGQVVDTLTVNTTGRQVQQLTLSAQKLGRVWRIFPADGNPSRLYSVQPVFDEEPFCLARWETQEGNFDQPDFFTPLDGQITLKSSVDVTLTVSIYLNQLGTIVQDQYTIPSTEGVKDKKYVPFLARKGVLVKYVLTATQPFWLYQEESVVRILPWGGDQALLTHPFGNGDVDRTREMVSSAVAAGRSGGGTA